MFVRFSTVQGSKGSPDTVRDVRGFATKFYTDEGIFDLVGNDIPVFFIQDAIKFPDLIHAVKPEPHNEMPQGGTAHDTFWDFFAQNPETMHTAVWAMSDRGIPKNFRQIEGFGVHTFRLVNSKGQSYFVKFHWKPVQGLESLVWDEAQILSGKDIDFHRKDLYEAIEKGDYPEWELGLQIIRPEQEFDFDFDILDPTKIWPEDEVPVEIVGKMTLNQNVSNVLMKQNKPHSILVTSYLALIFLTILYYKDVYSHIQIRKYQDWADQTLIKFQLIDQLTKYTTIKETLCIK